MKIILASASPRRRDLVRQIGWTADVVSGHFDEVSSEDEAEKYLSCHENYRTYMKGMEGPDLVSAVNAFGKGLSVAGIRGDDIPVVSADTIVVLGNAILGKPGNRENAFHMLSMLSGREHMVKTSFAVFYKGKAHVETVTTRVYFRKLSEAEINAYIDTGEPMDKAGAYGIQGRGTVFVERIDGSYDNVVGLPLESLYKVLELGQMK